MHQKTLWGTLIKYIHSKTLLQIDYIRVQECELKNKIKEVGEDYGIIIIHSQGYEILCNVKLIGSLFYLITEL